MPYRRRLAVSPIVVALASSIVVATSACRSTVAALGPSPDVARANADGLFRGLAVRFLDVRRAPKWQHARTRISRHALSPSGILLDSTVWSSIGGDGWRRLTLRGTLTPNGYLFTPAPAVPRPAAAGDARHHMALRRLGEDEYEWVTEVDHAIGTITAEQTASAITAFLGAAEGRAAADVRADYRTSFPRTTRALGKLFSLDSLRITPVGDGSSLVLAGARLRPARLDSAAMPNFARYVRKYLSPSRYDISLRDGRGTPWLEMKLGDELMTFRLRTRGGELLPLTGPPRPIPDSLLVRMSASAKFKIFRVGVSNLVGDFTRRREPNVRSWDLRFRREPDWHFPLAINNLMRSSLRRPFEKGGMVLTLGVRDSAGAQSLLERHAYVAVKESAIVRWLGGLGFTAMNDFIEKAEVEENRWLVEVLGGLRSDMVAILGGQCARLERACGDDSGP